MREADASQKRGLAALIGPRHDDQAFTVGRDLVADRALVHAEREADVVEILARERDSPRLHRGERERGAQREKSLVQVETADIERQFHLQHPKEAVDVLDAFGQRIGGDGDAAVSQLRHRACARFVAGGEIDCVGVGTTQSKKALRERPVMKPLQDAAEPFPSGSRGRRKV